MDSSYLFDNVPFSEETESFEENNQVTAKKIIDPTKPAVKRLFVGNLNYLQDGETMETLVQDIMQRFIKYGKILMTKEDPKETTLYIGKNFAHVTMKFDTLKQYQNLTKSYNKINFKGNKLILQEAKPSYKEKIAQEIKQNELVNINKYNKEIIRKDYEHYKKLENIKRTFRDKLQVIPGRNRVTKRNYVKSDKDEKTGKLVKYNKQRKQTFRIFLNGSLKLFQLKEKKKLWGVQKGRSLRDLAFEFDEKTYTWKNGLGHTIEHLNYKKLARNERMEIERQKEAIAIEEEEEDNEMDADVLTNIFNRIDFDKQVEVGEDGLGDKNEYGSDYEMKHGIYDEESEEDNEEEENQQKSLINMSAESKSNASSSESEKSSSGSESDSDISLDSNDEEALNKEEEEEEEEEGSESSEEDFMPKFGVSKTATTETISNTEKLRGLFQPKIMESEENSGLRLIVDDDDDIDHEKDNEIKNLAEDAKQFKSLEVGSTLASMTSGYQIKRDVGLFFPHFDSYFMQPQTSLNKIKTNQIETFVDWDEKFWENRGKWTNEFKQRKRAELKKSRKKQTTSNLLL
ncbi:hypothetical protein QEN19_003994 [Hanseniaspora menglaensis]